jgi:3-methyladenine DNA glycosylase/8-oxoguanine DNA glycosylase
VTKLPEPTFSAAELPGLCDTVASLDPDLQRIVDEYGYPEFWNRPNTFESFVWFILEQQVSLASAKAALGKLRAVRGESGKAGMAVREPVNKVLAKIDQPHLLRQVPVDVEVIAVHGLDRGQQVPDVREKALSDDLLLNGAMDQRSYMTQRIEKAGSAASPSQSRPRIIAVRA